VSTGEKQSVLFLCVGNSCRSQMAEGWLRHLGGDRYDVHSAGILQSYLRPETVAAMREAGVDISKQWSKTADVYAGRDFDLVVTTCDEAKEACPLFPGAKRMLHWSIPDPVGRGPEAYRAARDQLRERIEREILA
jgi:arsenate reductase